MTISVTGTYTNTDGFSLTRNGTQIGPFVMITAPKMSAVSRDISSLENPTYPESRPTGRILWSDVVGELYANGTGTVTTLKGDIRNKTVATYVVADGMGGSMTFDGYPIDVGEEQRDVNNPITTKFAVVFKVTGNVA